MALLLLHGSADSPRCWAGVLDRLDHPDAHAPALPAAPASGAALEHDMPWLESLIDRLGPVDLVAHSYGALLALRYTLAHPGRVRRLGLCEPIAFHLLADRPQMGHIDALNASFFGHLERGEPELGLEGLVDYWNGQGAWRALPDGARGRLLSRLPRTAAEVASGRDDRTVSTELAEVDVPCVVLAGEHTTPASLAVCQRIADEVPAPFAFIRGAGHQAPRTHPVAVAQAIRALLRR